MRKLSTQLLGIGAVLLAMVPAAGPMSSTSSPRLFTTSLPHRMGASWWVENGGEAFTIKEIRGGEVGVVAEIDARQRLSMDWPASDEATCL